MKKALALGALGAGFIIFSSALHAQLDPNAPWPMFRRDLSHTGRSAVAGPISGKLLWSYEAGTLFGELSFSAPAKQLSSYWKRCRYDTSGQTVMI